MKRTFAKKLARQIENSSSFNIQKLQRKEWYPLNLPFVNEAIVKYGMDVLAVYRIEYGGGEYWFMFANWRLNDEYYLVIFFRQRNIRILAEFHKIDHSEISWKYSPTKQDGLNRRRKQRFKKMYGSTDVRISLPIGEITVDDFLSDVFCVVDFRKMADDLTDILRKGK